MNDVTSRASRYHVTRHDAEDAWTYGKGCTDWESHYEQLTSAPFRAHVTEAWLGPVQVFHEEVNSPFRYHGRSWKGSRVFFASLGRAGGLYYHNRPLPANVFGSHRWDSAERLSCTGGFASVLIAVDEDFFQHYADRVVGLRFLPDRHNTAILSSDPAIVTNLQRHVLNMLRDLTAAPDVLANDRGRRAAQDSVLGILMEALEVSQGSGVELPPPSTRAYIVDKAVQFMESRLAESIVLAEVCEAVRVSPRTLRYSFEEILGVSPTRYLLARRLNQVRRDLSAAAQYALIEEVAVRSGFWHMGRFAQFYQQTFGERPSETRRRVQALAS